MAKHQEMESMAQVIQFQMKAIDVLEAKVKEQSKDWDEERRFANQKISELEEKLAHPPVAPRSAAQDTSASTSSSEMDTSEMGGMDTVEIAGPSRAEEVEDEVDEVDEVDQAADKGHSGVFLPIGLQCNLCLQTFSKMSNLRRHGQSVHTTGVQVTCHKCKKTLSNQGKLNKHLERGACKKEWKKMPFPTNRCSSRCPPAAKSIQCGWVLQVCEKEFSNSSARTRHLNAHRNEKPFLCEICQEGYNRKDELARHMIKHAE
jgi:Zinc finger, C2H2 type